MRNTGDNIQQKGKRKTKGKGDKDRIRNLKNNLLFFGLKRIFLL
jgi:hypothetical protein